MTPQQQAIYAVPDAEQAGAIVYWRLSGAVDAVRLTESWSEAGLAEAMLPETPTPEAALRRAVYEQKSRRRLVRKLPNGKGWAIVDERVEGDDLKYDTGIRVFLNKIGQAAFAFDENNEERAAIVCGQIAFAFNKHLDEFTATDISSWLVRFASKCGAVSLRERGGIYFVPRTTIEHWRLAVNAIKLASDHHCYEIPALKSSDAVDAILDAVVREAQAATDEMQEEMSKGDLQSRALINRSDRCDQVLAKLKQYEDLLGANLGEIAERVDDLKADITIATLANSGEGY
ncbi:MAG: DUF6744 family protein [Alphaproteobacteria bacterium]